MRVHPFPSRTRQLSSSVPTILGGQPPGKIGRRRHKKELRPKGLSSFLFQRHPMSRGLPFGRTVRNIVASLAWSASRRSLFLPVRRAPFICRRQRGPANPPGKIGRRRHKKATSSLCWLFFYAGVFFCRGLLQPPGKIELRPLRKQSGGLFLGCRGFLGPVPESPNTFDADKTLSVCYNVPGNFRRR